MDWKHQWKYHLLLGFIIVFMNFFSDYVYGGEAKFLENFKPFLLILAFTFFTSFFTVYAINYLLICPNTLGKKKIFLFFLFAVGMLFFFPAIRFSLEEVILYQLSGYHNYADTKRTFGYYIFDNSYYAVKALLFSTFMYQLFSYLEDKEKFHELKIEHKRAEMDLLKNQLEPHFMFNTLNAFYTELIEVKPKIAKSIYKLSELLRYVTYEAHQDFMPLERELRFIEDYIYFYEMRYEDSLSLDFKIEGIVKYKKIPSLLLIHFVENTFKHGVLNNKLHPAKIHIHIKEDSLRIETKNKVSNGQHYSMKGIGRKNLQKRLSLMFGDQYQFKFNSDDVQFESLLEIPLMNNSGTRLPSVNKETVING